MNYEILSTELALTAYNFAGESQFSNEIEVIIRGGDLLRSAPIAPLAFVIN